MTGAPGTMTETPAEATTPQVPLEQALNRLQLDGAIFFRSEFTEAWAYASPRPAASSRRWSGPAPTG